MEHRPRRLIRLCVAGLAAVLVVAVVSGCGRREHGRSERVGGRGVAMRTLSHEQTLQWIREHRAWRLARKTQPILARPVEPEEVGRPFETADRAVERAQAGYWLCVGVIGEPWFQKLENIEAKYD